MSIQDFLLILCRRKDEDEEKKERKIFLLLFMALKSSFLSHSIVFRSGILCPLTIGTDASKKVTKVSSKIFRKFMTIIQKLFM